MRWVILALLTGFACLGYAQRTGITVISARIVSDAILTQVQIGWALTAFLISYTALQLVGGVLGEWLGARWTFVLISLVAVLAMLLLAASPLLGGTLGILTTFLAGCSLLGAAQAPIFPVASGAIEAWFPFERWGIAQGLLTAGVHVASATAAPISAWLIEGLGWNLALIVPSIAGLALTAVWLWLGRDSPVARGSNSGSEPNEVLAEHSVVDRRGLSLRVSRRVLADRNILLLSASYMCMNFVFYFISFWCVLYLVQQRHFSILQSGMLASIPYGGAALGGVLGGLACDRLTASFGPRVGFRIVPMIALPAAGVFLLAAVNATGAPWAVAALAMAFGSIELSEGPFLAAATAVAREHTMPATAVVNTGGNLGGIIATPIVAALSARGGWEAAFITAALFAGLSAVLWIWIDGGQSLRSSTAAPLESTSASARIGQCCD